MAMEAPVASSRHNIFSEMPFSDFSRHGIFPVSTRSSSSFGAPSGSLTIVPSLEHFPAKWEPVRRRKCDNAKESRACLRFDFKQGHALDRQLLKIGRERMHP